MAKVIHFEIGVDQPERAVRFYQEVFGWSIQQWEGQEYWFILAGDEQEPGISGALIRRLDPAVSTINSINVASIDQAMSQVSQKGGQVLSPKTTLPGIGYTAYCVDTEGNVFCIMQVDPSAGTQAPVRIPPTIRG